MLRPSSKSTILLLGGYGFLGSRIASVLEQEGIQVLHHTETDLVEASAAQWDEWAAGASTIVNAAGLTFGPLGELTRSNALLVACALETAQRNNMRFIHLASAAEYGRTPEGHAACEEDMAAPLSPYGATKLAGTVLLTEAIRTGRVDGLAFRLTNPLGRGMNSGSLPGKAARELIGAVAEERQKVQFGPLGAMRDFIAVNDVALAVYHALPGRSGANLQGIANLGSGEARPVRDVVNVLAELAGFQGEIEEDAPGSPRSADVPYQRADMTKMQQSGFKAQMGFREALTELYESLL